MRDPWLAVILLLAAALRLYGLGHGLPFVYNPDEVNIMARALSVAQDPNPHYFLYPTFFFYFLFGVMGGLFVVGRLSGYFADVAEFQNRFFEDPTVFYLAGRMVGVLAALATVALTYYLSKRHFGRSAARGAALFVAVAYFHVRDSHYLKHDVSTGFLILLALVAFDRVMESPSLRAYIASGLAMGVAFATHYYTIFLAPTFVVCHWVSWGFKEQQKLIVAAGVSAVTFFLLSPFVILDFGLALDHMKANRQVVVDRSLDAGLVLLPALPAYLKFLAEQGFGYVLLALVVAGWVLIARSGFNRLVLWSVFPFLFLLLISYTFFAGRYLNAIAPALAVAGGVSIAALNRRWGRATATGVAVLACVQPVWNDLQIDRLFAGEDTRTLAYRWILDRVPDGQAVALQSYSVPLPQSGMSFLESMESNDALDELERRGKYAHLAEIAAKSHPAYELFFLGRGDEKNRIYFDYREVTEQGLGPLYSRGVETVVLRYAPDEAPADVASYFETVKAHGRLEARFTPFRDGADEIHPYMDNEDWPARGALTYKGPLVEVWTLEKD